MLARLTARGSRKGSEGPAQGYNTARSSYVRENSQFVAALTEAELQAFRDIFVMFDANGNGALDVGDLSTAMHALGSNPSDEEVAALIKEVDTTGTGEIDFDEFIALMARSTSNAAVEDQMHEVFERFDRDGDGFIGPEDLQAALPTLLPGPVVRTFTRAEAESMIVEARADDNPELRLSFEEFAAFMEDMSHVT
eukprot:RCo028984